MTCLFSNAEANYSCCFDTLHCWTQLFALVQIIEEESPLHIPREAFSRLASVPSFQSGKVPRAAATSPLPYELSDDEATLHAAGSGSDIDAFDYSDDDDDDDSGAGPEDATHFSTESDDLLRVLERGDESSEEEERPGSWRNRRVRRRAEDAVGSFRGGDTGAQEAHVRADDANVVGNVSTSTVAQVMYGGESSGGGHVSGVKRPREGGWGAACKAWATDAGKWKFRAQCSAWPHWVYRQFDAYDLARRAAGHLSQTLSYSPEGTRTILIHHALKNGASFYFIACVA